MFGAVQLSLRKHQPLRIAVAVAPDITVGIWVVGGVSAVVVEPEDFPVVAFQVLGIPFFIGIAHGKKQGAIVGKYQSGTIGVIYDLRGHG